MTGLASSAGAADSKFAKFRGKFLHDWPDFGGEKKVGRQGYRSDCKGELHIRKNEA
jgi:hypothetical protein